MVSTESRKFYKTNSLLYIGTGYIPICKECFSKLYNDYIGIYNDERNAMLRLCMAFDIYFDDKLFDKCFEGGKFIIGEYIKALNLQQHKGKTFDTTLDEGLSFKGAKDKVHKFYIRRSRGRNPYFNPDEDSDISQEDIDKWGSGLEDIDYENLNKHYAFLKESNPNCDSNQEIFIDELCYTKMQQMRAVRKNKIDDYNKMTESYRKSFQQAGLKTIKETAGKEDFSIGVNAEMIEKYCPAEYYKNKKLFKDFDGVKDYFKRFVWRPLHNLMYGTEDRDTEFYVKEEETGANEYSD